ncbi:peptidylprolyl isomerase [Buchnera aphidicola]|uniref:peptidylprolyl isomerase n=1 Tax=Buchnera aphidicola TaxID=9 RepID=UPI002283E55F|nr:peptidylprolyl isomerase [Buchnera aphidicola]
MTMKIWIVIILYIFTSIFYVLSKEIEIDNIAAVVNDQIILNSDVKKILFLLKKEGQDFRIPLKSDFLKEKVIQKLILDELLLQESKKMNITVTQEQINSMIKNIALKKNISMNQLKNYILFHDSYSNFSYKNYEKNIKKLLQIKIIQDYEINKRVNVTEEEVNVLFKKLIHNNKKFKKINLSYILIPLVKDRSNYVIDDKRKLANSLVTKLKKGYDFEKLYIECKKNKVLFSVKKMFWIHLLDMKNTFLKTLDVLEKGQILGPFLGDKGFYIFKVNDIRNNKENISTEFYVQHCLIKPSIIINDEESRNNIWNIYRNIKRGVYSFDYAVKNLSNDFYSANKNGDLGWISEGMFHGNFKKILFSLKKNEVSEPVRSEFGWHIVKILDKREIDYFYNFKKKQAYNILFFKKMVLEKDHWIEDLKNFSYINIIRP